MIKFFRRIRLDLLEKNPTSAKATAGAKTGKYLKYAIGEIVLVVIGILIAVSINSKYNANQNEQKFKNILTQIQKELVIDINDAKRIFDVKMGKDSISRKIYYDTITLEQFKKNPYELIITNNYVSFTTQKGGYNRLIQNLENLPDKYNIILPFLNDMYVERQNDIDDYNESIKNTVMLENRQGRFINNPKHADYILGNYSSDEQISYFLNDPYRKNRTFLYMNDLQNISEAANDYKIEAIKLYKVIDSLLGTKTMGNNDAIRSIPLKDSIESFIGNYKEIDEFLDIPDITLSIENKHIVLRNSIRDYHLYWHKENLYSVLNGHGTFMLYKNQNGRRIIKWSNGRYVTEFMHEKDIN